MAIEKPDRVLLIARHAKAEPQSLGIGDHKRSLARRGVEQCGEGREWLRGCGWYPDACLASDATRTTETANLLLRDGPQDCPVQLTNDLYEVSGHHFLEVVVRDAGDTTNLLVVGHQPTVSVVVSVLTGRHLSYPTGTIVAIGLKGPWSELGQESGWVLEAFRPTGSDD